MHSWRVICTELRRSAHPSAAAPQVCCLRVQWQLACSQCSVSASPPSVASTPPSAVAVPIRSAIRKTRADLGGSPQAERGGHLAH